MSGSNNPTSRISQERAAGSVLRVEDEKKTKEQLMEELAGLRQRISTLEASETERKAIETELTGTRQQLEQLLAVSPAIIYTTHASGDYACTFVSENIKAITGYEPRETITDLKHWPTQRMPRGPSAKWRL